MKEKIAFQGEKGAYSHLASLEIFPNAEHNLTNFVYVFLWLSKCPRLL